jgi:hypothetical protein
MEYIFAATKKIFWKLNYVQNEQILLSNTQCIESILYLSYHHRRHNAFALLAK